MLLKLKKNRKGFTLIELIVVVAIIAILAAIAVPTFLGMQDKARQGVYTANAAAWCGAINVYNSSVTDGSFITGVGTAIDTSALDDEKLTPTFSGTDDPDGDMGLQMVKIDANNVASVDFTIKPTK